MSIGINILLNGRIYNLRSTALPGGTGVIGQGILRPEETNVAVKVCRCAGTSNQQVGEVCALYFSAIRGYRVFYLACRP